jgi:hypothetical protein
MFRFVACPPVEVLIKLVSTLECKTKLMLVSYNKLALFDIDLLGCVLLPWPDNSIVADMVRRIVH